jgi:hypothetical protein
VGEELTALGLSPEGARANRDRSTDVNLRVDAAKAIVGHPSIPSDPRELPGLMEVEFFAIQIGTARSRALEIIRPASAR